MGCDTYKRLIVKMSTTASEAPTVPTSDDHRNGDWIATDIYVGELFYNCEDAILYTRDLNDNIQILATANNDSNRVVEQVNSSQNISTSSRYIIVDTTSGIVTCTLPSAETTEGMEFTFKRKAGANDMIITSTAGNIDGAATQTYKNINDFVTVVSDGGEWFIIAEQ